MRRRNRKKGRLHGNVVPLPFAGLLVMAAAVALVYVWLGYCQNSLGREYKALEKEREELNKKYLNEEYKWTRIKSPRNLALALERHNLAMTWPLRSQVVHLPNPPAPDGVEAVKPHKYDRVVMND